jgi:hypothetical protein
MPASLRQLARTSSTEASERRCLRCCHVFKAYQVGGERISPPCQIADRRAAKKHAGNKEKSSLSHVEIKRWAKSFDRACGNLPNIWY